jgi:alpha-mannosidase
MKYIATLCGILLCASFCAGQTKETADPYKPVLDRLESLTVLDEPEWKYHEDVAHPEDASVSDTDWAVVKEKEHWKTGSRVLRRWIEIPEKINGYSTAGAKVNMELFFSCEGTLMITVYSNGSLIARGNDDQQQPLPLTESAKPGQKFLIAVRLDGPKVDTGLPVSRLRIAPVATRLDPNFLRTEILAVRPMIAAFPEKSAERNAQVEEAVKAVDFTALDRGDQAGFDSSLAKAQDKLKTLNPWLKTFTIRAAGNSHIDMAWLWPWTETVEVVRNTFRSALDLMSEYPDLTFSMSSAQTYSWMEEKYPDIFKEIQQRVMEGRWEIVGGMWVEPDLNMPGGESLVRQLLVGKRYFHEKFGVDVKIGWNPDSFGYSWQLPQIYKKSGLDYFVTQKIYWNDTTKFPYKLFWWESPDGSKVMAYIPHDYSNDSNPIKMAHDLSMYAPAMYASEPPTGRELLHLFGVGDHGGGPTREMLETAKKWMSDDVVFPRLRFSTAKGFFDDLQKDPASLNLPTWRNEMYFEYHRGVLTTQAETKRRIRTTEELLLDAEKFGTLASLFGKKYPDEKFDGAWKGLLFDDFHDIFPGSGIAVNYLDAKRNLETVSLTARTARDSSIKEIGAHIHAQGSGVPVVVFNSMSWPRKEVLEIEAQLPMAAHNVEVTDGAGKIVPSQLIRMEGGTNRAHLLVQANVPSLGYVTYYVRGTEKPTASTQSVHATTEEMENDLVRLKVDPKSGCVTSLVEKRTGVETLAAAETDTGGPKDSACGDLLQAFRDKPKDWDAWNIDADFEKEHWDLNHADEISLVKEESGSLRAVLRVKKHFQNSQFTEDIVMTEGSPRVDVKMTAEWHEKHILLKVAFPVSVHADKATFEIPFGSIERPTTRNTPAEQAQFEVPGMQWADISDAKHGFSLLNDCKYGYDAKGNVLRLSLLRSPEWPDPHADEGTHVFTYSMYPHAGSWKGAETVRQGYDLNYPLIFSQIEKHSGELKDRFSFVEAAAPNVVLTAVKKSEDNNEMVLRFYEWAGKETDVKIVLPAGAESASDADLMEKSTGALAVSGDSVTVHTKPYEIKTVRVGFKAKTAM